MGSGFEPSKTHMMVVSKKEKRAFDPTGVVMGTSEVGQVVEVELVGFTFEEKLDRVQATMERIGGFKAEALAARREAALVA